MGSNTRLAEKRKAYRGLYNKFHSGAKCYYCGQSADTIDHVPALEVALMLGADNLSESGIKLITVKSCRECNALLGNRAINTLDERAEYIYHRLQKRYKRLINSEEWPDDDLEELGTVLKSYISIHANAQFWIERRLQYMEDLFYDVLSLDD